MTALEILCDLIADSEGCRLEAYLCPAKVWTIGYGYTGKDIKRGTRWSQEHANDMLLKRAQQAINEAIDASPILAYQNAEKIAAISDFIYNCGIGAYLTSTLKKYVDKTNWKAAQVEILKWNRVGGIVLKGLTIRRQKEAELLG
jgi:lysozyme